MLITSLSGYWLHDRSCISSSCRDFCLNPIATELILRGVKWPEREGITGDKNVCNLTFDSRAVVSSPPPPPERLLDTRRIPSPFNRRLQFKNLRCFVYEFLLLIFCRRFPLTYE
jgi:hypothetical protein